MLDFALPFFSSFLFDARNFNSFPCQVVLFGRSLGGAVALALASLTPAGSIGAVIVENTFTSIDSMVLEIARTTLGLRHPRLRTAFSWFLYFYLTSHWASSQVISNIGCPVLFLSGQNDELVPPAQMQRLYEAASGAAFRDIVLFPGGTHNETHLQDPPRYYAEIIRFLHKTFSGDKTQQAAKSEEGLAAWLDKVDSVRQTIQTARAAHGQAI